jgi:hypothetical protein
VLLSAHEMNPLLPVMDRVVYLAGGRAASGTTDEVVRTEVLSALYGHQVDVLRSTAGSSSSPGPTDPGDDLPTPSPGTSRDRSGLSVHWVFEPGFFSSQPVHVALTIGGVVAVVSAVVGVFTVMRGQSFAGHALTDVSTAGGSAAFLLGINPLLGFVGGGVVGAGPWT